MNSWIIYSVAFTGVIIVAVLATIAWRLQGKVRQQQRERAIAQAVFDKKTNERRDFVLNSLEIISTNVLEEGLNLTEATIRCKILLDSLELPEIERERYKVLDQVFSQVQEFDTHQARKDLTPAERLRQDLRREEIESEFEATLKECFARLQQINSATLQ